MVEDEVYQLKIKHYEEIYKNTINTPDLYIIRLHIVNTNIHAQRITLAKSKVMQNQNYALTDEKEVICYFV